MSANPLPDLLRLPAFCAFSETLQVRAASGQPFLDLTDRIATCVASSRIEYGLVNVQVRHTSAALTVNENEPLLLQDFERLLEQLAPREASYGHNRFDIRAVSMEPDERPNGHAHARALLLRTSGISADTGGLFALGPLGLLAGRSHPSPSLPRSRGPGFSGRPLNSRAIDRDLVPPGRKAPAIPQPFLQFQQAAWNPGSSMQLTC